MQCRRDEDEKERVDCVRSDVRAFGLVGGWKEAALEAKVWVETATERRVEDDGRVEERGGRRG